MTIFDDGSYGPPQASQASEMDGFNVLNDMWGVVTKSASEFLNIKRQMNLYELETNRLKASAYQSGAVNSATSVPFSYSTVDYEKWGLVVAVAGVVLAVYLAFRS